LTILGIRGIPARHGGFETFAEKLSLYLVNNGWKVTVYCQDVGEFQTISTKWKGVIRIHISVKKDSPFYSILFDLKSIWHARKTSGIHLILGYNTSIFNIIDRI